MGKLTTFEFLTDFSRSDNSRDVYQFTAFNTGTVRPKKYEGITKKHGDKARSAILKTPFCFNPGISEIEAVSNSPFVHNFERTENHIVTSSSIQQISEANSVENTLKLYSSSGQIVSPFVHNFEGTDNHIVSKESNEKASKANDVEKTVKISCSSMCKFKASSSVCEASASCKSIFVDEMLDFIRQIRMSWWSQDETPSNIESQTSPNLTVEERRTKPNQTSNGDSFHKGDQYESDNESKDSSCNDKYQRNYRVGEPENWQSKMTSRDKSSRSDSKEWIAVKPKVEKSISWWNKFRDESDLDDSESSLDGSYRHHRSDSCDSSRSESSEDSLSYKYCRHFEPPNSSIVVENFHEEYQIGHLETLRKQFWESDLVKYPDNFYEEIGFIAVVLLALLCLCQYCDN